MKKIWFFLFIYLIGQLRPVVVITGDLLLHTFFRAQHLATVHYENGHFHVHTELAAVDQEQSASKEKANPSSLSEAAAHECVNGTEINKPLCNEAVRLVPASYYLTTVFKSIESPPPRYICTQG